MHRALHTSNLQMLQLMRNLFEERGKFRAIKYAVRRKGPLCYPGEDGNSGHGMTCCMFAITCYQSAGIAGEVNKLDPGNPYMRNSDKKMTRGDLAVLQKMMAKDGFAPADFEAYRRYVEMIQDVNEYKIDWAAAGGNEVVKAAPAKKWVGYTYIPSILFWKRPAVFSTFDWAAAVTPGMMLDAKIANPEHIRQSLEADAGNWEYIGSMKQETAAPTDSQKLVYQQALQQNQQAADQLRQGFARSLPPTHRPGHH
jgi:6-phosphogluconate dehydrogenase (decarboxylating)